MIWIKTRQRIRYGTELSEETGVRVNENGNTAESVPAENLVA